MTNTNAHTIDRPAAPYRANKRAMVWHYRACAAYDAAAARYNGVVTAERMDAAADVLARATRYALADLRMLETETAENVNNPARIHRAELLERRRDHIAEELEPYGLTIGTAWICPNVYDAHGRAYLHFFD